MDEATIQKLAAEIARHLPSYSWTLLAVQGVLMLVAAGVGAYLGAYFKERGKNLATKHDFDELQRQLEATTETVETIKSEVGQRDWAQREWTNLRRIKLEELMEKMHDCEASLDRLSSRASKGDFQAGDPNHMGQLDAIQALYFSELQKKCTASLTLVEC